jgi:hypothetical protein
VLEVGAEKLKRMEKWEGKDSPIRVPPRPPYRRRASSADGGGRQKLLARWLSRGTVESPVPLPESDAEEYAEGSRHPLLTFDHKICLIRLIPKVVYTLFVLSATTSPLKVF